LYGHPQEDEEKHVKVDGDQKEQKITILFLLHFSISVNIHFLWQYLHIYAHFLHLLDFTKDVVGLLQVVMFTKMLQI